MAKSHIIRVTGQPESEWRHGDGGSAVGLAADPSLKPLALQRAGRDGQRVTVMADERGGDMSGS